MPRKLDYLALYRFFLPAGEMIKRLADDERPTGVDDPIDGPWYQMEDMVVAQYFDSNLTVFDCRELPLEFVEDTGAAVFEDMMQLGEQVKLPFDACYFEFAGEHVIFATVLGHHVADEETLKQLEQEDDEEAMNEIYETGNFERYDEVIFWGHEDWTRDGSEISAVVNTFHHCQGEFPHGHYDGRYMPGRTMSSEERRRKNFFTSVNSNVYGADEDANEQKNLARAHRLLGVLSLLNERLVVEQYVPDPAPRLTLRRLKESKRPLTGPSHVLRVNVPAVRRIARATPLGTHESPALHWRRGHERVLHRFSEYESKVWVRKCLVGDPSKGFVGKSYKLVQQLPIAPIEHPRVTF